MDNNEEMAGTKVTSVVLGAALVCAGCNIGPDTTSMTTTTTTTTTTVAAAPPSQPASDALMPAVVCMNLQDAQNLIQKHGVFYSRSEDATGQGRAQIMDRNWIVIAQQPEPGTHIGEGEAVLSVVKDGEPNDC